MGKQRDNIGPSNANQIKSNQIKCTFERKEKLARSYLSDYIL